MPSIRPIACASLALLALSASIVLADDRPRRGLSREQQLIVACFRLEVERVKELVAAGVSVNGTMGKHDHELFKDKWTLEIPLGSGKWTPLLAVANSNQEPDPDRETENTTEARNAAFEAKRRIDPKLIKERDNRRVTIAKSLMGARARIDEHDGYGATALYVAVDNRSNDLALCLIEAGAEVNTRTGVYIDGLRDITPLHQATGSPQVLKALLTRGAKVDARDSDGQTPLHWAVLRASPVRMRLLGEEVGTKHLHLESIRLLIAAGADAGAKDTQGRTPLSWTDDSLIVPNLLKARPK